MFFTRTSRLSEYIVVSKKTLLMILGSICSNEIPDLKLPSNFTIVKVIVNEFGYIYIVRWDHRNIIVSKRKTCIIRTIKLPML